jgi:hypothetical protein
LEINLGADYDSIYIVKEGMKAPLLPNTNQVKENKNLKINKIII